MRAMPYAWLLLAIVFEVGWALAMKLSQGLTRPGPTIATIVMYILSVVFLSRATRSMDVGVAYALWAGTGVACIAVAGMLWFKEPMTPLRACSLGAIVLGVVGLSLAGAGHSSSTPSGAVAP